MKNNFQPFIFEKNKSIRVDRFLIIGTIPCKEDEYDLFSMSVPYQNLPFFQKVFAVTEADFPLFQDCTLEGKNTFSSFQDCKQKKLYLYTEVVSKEKTRIIVQIACNRYARLWLNDKLLTIHTNDQPIYMSAWLNPGNNVFLLERYDVMPSDLLSMRLYDYQREMSDHYDSLSQLTSHITIDPVLFISDSQQYLPDSETYRFMFFSSAESLYENEFLYDIHDTFDPHLSDLLIGHLNHPIDIDLTPLRNLRQEPFRYVGIICRLIEKATNEKEERVLYLILNDFPEARQRIVELTTTLAQSASPDTKLLLEGALATRAKKYQNADYFGEFWALWDMNQLNISIENGTFSFSSYLYKAGAKVVYFRSCLDKTLQKIVANVPQNFSLAKKYPTVFSIPIGYEGYYSREPISKLLPEEALCFDLCGRGATGGSYIGEAQILETISWIRQRFPIDENRIYLLGQSNGGYATYAIAQNHPDLAAAIYPQVGYPHISMLANLSNTPTYQTVSTGDYIFRNDKNFIKQTLARFHKYYQYDFEDLTHNQMLPYLYHRDIMKNIFDQKREPYPSEIHFVTERNRHCKSFWIHLHGISVGYKTANISAKIKSQREIKIRISGSDGVEITIPPEIDRTNFSIQINRHKFVFQNCYEKSLNFHKNKKWQVIKTAPRPDYRKGTGILDVYLNSLRIVIPDKDEKSFTRTAEAFSHPQTSAFLPDIAVQYPILRDGENLNELTEHNLILIDDIHTTLTNPIATLIEKALPVQCNIEGFFYKNIFYKGNYTVMQIVAHPYDPSRSILSIRTNSRDYLSRCFFSRKVILPFYYTGRHPFYNNEILAFQNGQYLSAYESGSNLSPVT